MIRKDNILKIIISIILIVGAIILLANNRVKENNNNENLNAENILNSEYTQNVENITNPYITELEDGQKENNSPALKEDKTFKKIDITNINFVYNPGNNMTTITADLINTGTEEQLQEIVDLKILGQSREEIVTIEALIPNIKPGETKKLRSSATADLSTASDFEIVEK